MRSWPPRGPQGTGALGGLSGECPCPIPVWGSAKCIWWRSRKSLVLGGEPRVRSDLLGSLKGLRKLLSTCQSSAHPVPQEVLVERASMLCKFLSTLPRCIQLGGPYQWGCTVHSRVLVTSLASSHEMPGAPYTGCDTRTGSRCCHMSTAESCCQ